MTGAAGFIGFSSWRSGCCRRAAPVVGLDNINELLRSEAEGGAAHRACATHAALPLRQARSRRPRRHRSSCFPQRGFPGCCISRRRRACAIRCEHPHAYVGREPRRLRQHARRLPSPRLPPSAVCVVVVGLRHQRQAAVLGAPTTSIIRSASTRPPKKANELMAHSYSHLYPAADHGPALLHGLRAVGPARHGAVHLRQGDPRRQADPAVQPRQDAARFHLRRRHHRGHGAPGRAAAAGRSDLVRRPARSGDQRARRGASTISATTSRPKSYCVSSSCWRRSSGARACANSLPMQPGDVPATYADVDDLMREVGFRPSTSIEEGVRRFCRLVPRLSRRRSAQVNNQ